MDSETLLVVFSVSAQSDIMERLKSTDSKILLVTTNKHHNYQELVDRTVVLPYLAPDPEASSVSPFLFDVFAELLVSYVAKHI